MSKKIPTDWKVESLEHLTDRLHQGVNTTAEKINYAEEGLPVLQAKHITSGRIDYSDIKYVSFEDSEKYVKNYQPSLNDILLTNIGTIGRSVLLKGGERPFLIAWNIFRISPKKDINPVFLKYFFELLDQSNYWSYFASGNATKFINKTVISEIEIPRPSHSEQKKIAEILTSVDRVIELASLEIDKLKDLKKGMMQELLTKGIGHTKFKDSPAGKIPESWGVKSLEAITSRLHQGVNTTAEKIIYSEKGMPILQAKHITSGKIEFNDLRYVSDKDSLRYTSSYLPEEGDILLTNIGTIGRSVIVKGADKKFLIAWNIFRISPQSGVKSQFLKYFFELLDLNNYWSYHATGNATKFINKSVISELQVPLPDYAEQDKITRMLTSIDVRIDSLELKKIHFIILKKGLMNDLITGKVRVKV